MTSGAPVAKNVVRQIFVLDSRRPSRIRQTAWRLPCSPEVKPAQPAGFPESGRGIREDKGNESSFTWLIVLAARPSHVEQNNESHRDNRGGDTFAVQRARSGECRHRQYIDRHWSASRSRRSRHP